MIKVLAKDVTQLWLGLLRTGMLFSTRLPLRRGGQPEEVARIAVVLASDLSSYVHGAIIPVDGGFLSAYGGRDWVVVKRLIFCRNGAGSVYIQKELPQHLCDQNRAITPE
jgi:hypothetical protein